MLQTSPFRFVLSKGYAWSHGAVTRRLYASAIRFRRVFAPQVCTASLHRKFAPQVCTGNIQGKLTRGKCLAEVKTNVRPDISRKVHLAQFTTLD